jgi:hypothetical protein
MHNKRYPCDQMGMMEKQNLSQSSLRGFQIAGEFLV